MPPAAASKLVMAVQGKTPAAMLALGLLLAAASVRSEEPGAAADADSCAERVVGAVERHYQGVRDLSARFEQTTRSALLRGAPLSPEPVSRGTVLLAKPGRMRWSYEEPEASLVVSDGATLWIYDPAAKEAQRLPAPREYLSGAALHFLLGEGNLLGQFDVTARDCGGPIVHLELVPREDATYERIGLAAEPSGAVRATTVTDLLGNVTEVAFHDVRLNTDPAPERFEFRPPAGVRVIELTPIEARP